MKRSRSKKGAPGIVEVAQRANVSPATVSRFFNAPGVVKQDTRKRIEQAASDLGYIRDRMAGMMHTNFSGTIGIVVPTIDNAIFAEMIDAFSTQLRKHDRTMLIAAHGYELGMEVAIIRSLLERRIDGVALIGLQHEMAPLEMLAVRNVPVLAAWNYRADSNIPCVGADNVEAGRQVTHYLLKRGHRDIAMIFPPTLSNDRAADRLKGAREALAKAKQPKEQERLYTATYDIGDAKEVVEALLREQRPTALLCGNDIIAQGAVYACQKMNLKIPDDISIIGIGDFRASAHMEPGLTTLRLPARRIGQEAADVLCSGILEGPASDKMRRNIPMRLQERASVRRLE